jgi:hypothetical protein
MDALPTGENKRAWKDLLNGSCVIRRAQSRIDQATLENEMGIVKTGVVEDQSAPIPKEITSELERIICYLARLPQ